jgi:hypothetical protein
MTHLTPQQREGVARALYHATPRNKPFDKLPLNEIDDWLDRADAALPVIWRAQWLEAEQIARGIAAAYARADREPTRQGCALETAKAIRALAEETR